MISANIKLFQIICSDKQSRVSYEIWLTGSKGTRDAVRAECQLREGGDLAGKEIFGFGPEGNTYFR